MMIPNQEVCMLKQCTCRSKYMLCCNLLSPVADRGDDVSPGRIPLEISGLCVLGIGDESELTGIIELQLTIHPARVDSAVYVYAQADSTQ